MKGCLVLPNNAAIVNSQESFYIPFQVQSTFYRYVASPLFEEWHRFLGSPLSTIMTRNLTSNQVQTLFSPIVCLLGSLRHRPYR